MYKFLYTERNNEKATEFETKSLLYLLSMREDSNEIDTFLIDCFNDVTGTNKNFNKLWDIQSKGVKSLNSKKIGKALITLFENYKSNINFDFYILFFPQINSIYFINDNQTVFGIENFKENHIQKIMEKNFWIFGEQYHLVTADKNFEKALEYEYVLYGKKSKEKYKIDNQDRLRRMDIFICAKKPLDVYLESSKTEENIVLELKAPYVDIDRVIFRQIEDYMDLIKKQPQFNSTSREWKFYAISNRIDDFIKDKYKENENKGFPFLVKKVDNCKIFIMTWDDVFKKRVS